MSSAAAGDAFSMAEPLVEMRGISKDFPGVHALADCQFDLYPGEVHALVGENGAGKSTLMKILAGVYRRDAGTVNFKGLPVDIASTGAAQRLGISMVHQELNLAPHLTLAQNIFLGREPRWLLPWVLDDRIFSMLVGRTIFESAAELPEHPSTDVVLEVRNLNRGRSIRDVSFQLRRGEILGIAGLVGAGRTEVARAVFGADQLDSGEIFVKGTK